MQSGYPADETGAARPRSRMVWPVYPFLFPLVPVLQLLSSNAGSADPVEVARPLLALEALTAAIFAVGWLVTRDRHRAALLTTAAMVCMFMFPGVSDILARLRGIATLPVLPVPREVQLPALVVCAGVLASIAWLLLRTHRPLHVATSVLNPMFVVWGVFMIGTTLLRLPTTPVRPLEPIVAPAGGTGRGVAPHIFYFVLDAYGRSDVLREHFGVDNEPFLAALRARGFFVAEQSRSNYPQTALSLASSLNATYLDAIVIADGDAGHNRRQLTALIDRNRVVAFLRERGYRFVTFSSGAAVVEPRHADQRLTSARSLSEFEHSLLAMTAVPASLRLIRMLPAGTLVPDQFALHRARVEWALDHVPGLAAADEPLFVLMHVLCPHPPFVFAADGGRPPLDSPARRFFIDGEDSGPRDAYVAGYAGQLAFLNRRLVTIIDRLLAVARRPVVIVIQGDHGPGRAWAPDDGARTDVRERFAILNAYRFPEGGAADLYPSITPVNTFRVVLNRLFDVRLQRLPDRSFYAPWSAPYRFTDVTDRVTGR
jgi:hypothetical protein